MDFNSFLQGTFNHSNFAVGLESIHVASEHANAFPFVNVAAAVVFNLVWRAEREKRISQVLLPLYVAKLLHILNEEKLVKLNPLGESLIRKLLFVNQVGVSTNFNSGLGGVGHYFGEHLGVRGTKVVDEGGLKVKLK